MPGRGLRRRAGVLPGPTARGVCGWRETRTLRHPLCTAVRATVADQSRSETTRRGRGNSGRECRRTHVHGSMAPRQSTESREKNAGASKGCKGTHVPCRAYARAMPVVSMSVSVLRAAREMGRVGRAIRRRAEWCCHGTVCGPRQRPRARSVASGSVAVAVASRGTQSLKLEPACCLLASCEPRQNAHVRGSGQWWPSGQPATLWIRGPVASGAFGAPSDRVRTACAPNRPPMAQKSKLSRAVVVASARRRPWKGFLEGAERLRGFQGLIDSWRPLGS
jgi:hypothetical protein